MDTLTILIEARKLIESPKHWCQGKLHYGGAHCSIGAIDRVTHGAYFGSPAIVALVTAIGFPLISVWNDHPRRKHSEVLAAFDKAIAAERAKFEAQFLDPQQTQSDCTEPSSTRAAAELVP